MGKRSYRSGTRCPKRPALRRSGPCFLAIYPSFRGHRGRETAASSVGFTGPSPSRLAALLDLFPVGGEFHWVYTDPAQRLAHRFSVNSSPRGASWMARRPVFRPVQLLEAIHEDQGAATGLDDPVRSKSAESAARGTQSPRPIARVRAWVVEARARGTGTPSRRQPQRDSAGLRRSSRAAPGNDPGERSRRQSVCELFVSTGGVGPDLDGSDSNDNSTTTRAVVVTANGSRHVSKLPPEQVR